MKKNFIGKSKRDSVYYREDTKGRFNSFADRLTTAILDKQSLDVSVDPDTRMFQHFH